MQKYLMFSLVIGSLAVSINNCAMDNKDNSESNSFKILDYNGYYFHKIVERQYERCNTKYPNYVKDLLKNINRFCFRMTPTKNENKKEKVISYTSNFKDDVKTSEFLKSKIKPTLVPFFVLLHFANKQFKIERQSIDCDKNTLSSRFVDYYNPKKIQHYYHNVTEIKPDQTPPEIPEYFKEMFWD
ncbi:MAG TPA: hypothetical protein ENI08_03610 [Candidatus Dependentiae bacterium]|nr:hypothetical protein [Candidatus Dependentiae bacterium]